MPNGEEDDSIYNHYSLIPKGTLTLTENSPVSFSSSWYVDQIVHSNLGLVKHDRMYQLLVFLSVAIPIIANPTETNNKQQDKIGFVSHNVNEISFLLYNDPRNPTFYRTIHYDDPNSLLSSGFQPCARTVIMIHGFTRNAFSEFPQDMKNTFLRVGYNYNFILINWGLLADPQPEELQNIMYPAVVENVPIVAERLCSFLMFMREVYNNTAISNIHMIGHSLGAHVAGVASRCLLQRSGVAVDRISGLDPAGPLFFPQTDRNLLPSDARFVDVYHTNGGIEGDKTQDGTVDVYPNGGKSQPICWMNDTNIIGTETLGRFSCSHRYAYRLYTSSITQPFTGCQCILVLAPNIIGKIMCSGLPNDCPGATAMGYHIPTTARGLYYARTS